MGSAVQPAQVGALVGTVKWSLVWTTGAWSALEVLSIGVPSIGFARPTTIEPWLLGGYLPVGALIVLLVLGLRGPRDAR